MANDFAGQVQYFLVAEKSLYGRFAWRVGSHKDYSTTTLRVMAKGEIFDSRLVLQARRFGEPIKLSMILLLNNTRVLALDINPQRWHGDKNSLNKILITHWHRWPDHTEADQRDLRLSEWFDAFLTKANIKTDMIFKPPHPGQPRELPL